MGLLTDILEKKVEDKHKDEEDRKRKLREFYYDRIHDDDTDPAVREQISGDYLKLLSPEAKKQAQKGLGIIGQLKQKFMGGPKKQDQQQQTPQTHQPAQTPATQQDNASREPQQSMSLADKFKQGPSQPQAQAPQPDAKVEQFKQGPQFFKDYGKSADKRKEDLTKYKSDLDRDAKIAEEKAKPQKLTPVMVQVKDKEKPIQALRSADGKYYDVNSGDALEIEKEMPKESTKGGYIRSVPHSVGLKDAKTQAANGAEFLGADGKMINLEDLPEDMGLQAMVRGNEMFWVPVTPTQKAVTVGGKVYGVNPYQIQDVGKQGAGGPVELGPSKTGSAHTSEQIAVNPVTGAVTKNTLRSTTTPQTPGAHQPGEGPAPAPAPIGSAPTPQQGAPKPTPAPQANSDIKGMPSGMYNQMLQRVTPVREAATQVFGDPSQPDLKGLKDYMQLADDPKARERIGTALRLTFDGLNQATSGGAHISAEAGPVSVSTGGIGQLFTNWLGVPQKTAEQQTKIIQDAINKMTPEEKEYYDSVMSAFSTVVGLRSLTRASAAQSSVSAIERELPIIGVNTTDSKQFADQMQRLAEIVYNGTKGIPPGMLDPQLVERIKTLPAEMQKRKASGPAKAPATKGKDDLKSKSVDELFEMLKK